MSLLSLPSAREEAWRWSDLSALPAIAGRQPSGRLPDALPWIDCACDSPRLLFVDGRLDREQSQLGPVSIGPVTTQPGDHALARLVGHEGWSLKLGRDHAPAGLVQIIHVSTGAADPLAAEVSLDFDAQASIVRSEERRVGKECVSTCRSRWSPYH